MRQSLFVLFAAPESKVVQRKKTGKQTTLMKTPPAKDKNPTGDKTPTEKDQQHDKKESTAKK